MDRQKGKGHDGDTAVEERCGAHGPASRDAEMEENRLAIGREIVCLEGQ